MCGIIGRFFKQAATHPDLTYEDLIPLKHRGPDSAGIYNDSHVQFGHTRLSMIDLTELACQPMSYKGGRFVITFNGEIYNYLELMNELRSKGEHFSTHSDTEVLLAAYNVWGPDCLKRFRGMFAFALWDKEKKSLFLARDRCGEKPLFFKKEEDSFLFASELKGLLPLLESRPKLDPKIIDMYLHYQFVPEPFTLLECIQKLPAAHYLILSLENWNASPVCYWNLEHPSNIFEVPTDHNHILKNIRETLEESVKLTLRSDVPVGVALSGGIDSGMIAAFAQKHSPEPLHAFTIGYPGRPTFDERNQARQLGDWLGMIVHEVELPIESFVDFFPQLVRIMDEPIADPAAFGHYSVPKAAADLGIKALLTGIGGDELFWGYSWVTQSIQINLQRRASNNLKVYDIIQNSPSLQKLIKYTLGNLKLPKNIRNFLISLSEQKDIYTPKNQLRLWTCSPDFFDAFSKKNLIYGDRMANLDSCDVFLPTEIGLRQESEIPVAIIRMLFDTWLSSNCLTLGDRVSMAVGVETRLPFLDVRLIELVTTLRLLYPDHELGQKFWLRSALKGVLPDEVLSRPKAGFQPPTYEWLSGVVLRYGHFLENGHLEKEGILRNGCSSFILEILAKESWPGLFFAYKLVLLEIWYREIVGE